jgi:hypothetical protein
MKNKYGSNKKAGKTKIDTVFSKTIMKPKGGK